MAKKKTRKIDPKNIRTMFKVHFPTSVPIRRMFGETVQFDAEKNMKFLELPAHPQIKRYVKDLHPDWKCSSDYIEYDEDGDEVNDG